MNYAYRINGKECKASWKKLCHKRWTGAVIKGWYVVPQVLDFRYWENKKEHKLSLATYPDLSLKDAHLKRDEIQTARAKCENPVSKAGGFPQVFSEVVYEWLTEQKAA